MCGLCRYQADLEALYTALEDRLKERLRAMKEGKDASVQDRIKQVHFSPSAITFTSTVKPI